jgi:hypothetical protein
MQANIREQRGCQIYMMKDQIKQVDINHYQVNSQSGNGAYGVLSTELGWICSCPDHVYRGLKCKHIYAVEFSLALRKQVESSVVIKEISILACPRCNSE